MLYDFFHKTESNTGTHKVKTYRFDLDTDDVEEALEMARELGLPKGSARCGCFEIQSDLGIWSHVNDKPLRWDRPDDITFTPWDDEHEEVQNAA
jgi:hypothetical protein